MNAFMKALQKRQEKVEQVALLTKEKQYKKAKTKTGMVIYKAR